MGEMLDLDVTHELVVVQYRMYTASLYCTVLYWYCTL